MAVEVHPPVNAGRPLRSQFTAGSHLAIRAVLVGSLVSTSCAAPSPDSPPAFDVMEKSISELSGALEAGEVTSQDLVRLFLNRIDAYDQQGPVLNTVIALNPSATDDAALLDVERATGAVRGPLHGIPVLVKDNYDTANMPTTGGVIGLATSIPPDDAFQVHRLRDAGAVILGKTNMHELARGITTVSSFAGQTRNPYDPTRNPGGSSGGTGAAVAASFAAVGMGSDTCGSIRIPASHHSLVGLRGTRGLASGDGIIPLSTTQDIGGPLARSVEDLAITLDATVGFDPEDPTTALSQGNIPTTYTAFLDEGALEGARIGVVLSLMGSEGGEQPVRDVIEAAIETLRGLGAELLEVEEPDVTELVENASVIVQEFKFDFDAYLAETPGAPVRSLEELVSLGLYHDVVDRGLRNSLELDSLNTEDYRERVAKRGEARAAVLEILEDKDLDALLYPTIRRTARPIGQEQPGSNCGLSSVTGLPAITVPAGFAVDDMPVGLELLARPFAESRLISLAYAFEQATRYRRSPDFTPSLSSPPAAFSLSASITTLEGVVGEATFLLDPATRSLSYSIAFEGINPSDVLGVDLHRIAGDLKVGPTLRRLDHGRTAVGGEITLEGREIRLLREARLYVDVHARDRVSGVFRVDLAFPEGG